MRGFYLNTKQKARPLDCVEKGAGDLFNFAVLGSEARKAIWEST